MNRAEMLLDKADRYLVRAEFFSNAAAKYLSASEELRYERAIWLAAIDGLLIRHDGFEENIEANKRIAKKCQRRAGVFDRKHDRTMRQYYRYIGLNMPTFLGETEYFLERKWWALMRKVGYGRYFGPQRKVRRNDHPSLF